MSKQVCTCLFALALLLTGCGRANQRAFPALGRVTLIKISDKEERTENKTIISGQRSIDQIVAFVDSNREGWYTPWYGIPVPVITAEFYDGQSFKGSFGVGKNFLETQREDGFWSKDTTPEEVRRFLDLVGKSNVSFNP